MALSASSSLPVTTHSAPTSRPTDCSTPVAPPETAEQESQMLLTSCKMKQTRFGIRVWPQNCMSIPVGMLHTSLG